MNSTYELCAILTIRKQPSAMITPVPKSLVRHVPKYLEEQGLYFTKGIHPAIQRAKMRSFLHQEKLEQFGISPFGIAYWNCGTGSVKIPGNGRNVPAGRKSGNVCFRTRGCGFSGIVRWWNFPFFFLFFYRNDLLSSECKLIPRPSNLCCNIILKKSIFEKKDYFCKKAIIYIFGINIDIFCTLENLEKYPFEIWCTTLNSCSLLPGLVAWRNWHGSSTERPFS